MTQKTSQWCCWTHLFIKNVEKLHENVCDRESFSTHCVKIVRIRSYSGPYSLAFGLNMERYSVPLRIHSEWGKLWNRKTPNTDNFHAVILASWRRKFNDFWKTISWVIAFIWFYRYWKKGFLLENMNESLCNKKYTDVKTPASSF